MTNIDEMVNRFLGWPLPKDFCPDCGISFDGRKDDEWNKGKTWPVGTNLLTAEQARAMFEHALGGAAARPVALTDEQMLAVFRTVKGNTIRLTRDVGPYEVTEPTHDARLLVAAVLAAAQRATC